jgi:hypothetical protein
MLIVDINCQPDPDYGQCEQDNEREHIQEHAALVIVLSIIAFEFSEAQ